MAQTKEIKKKIGSVQNTKKITSAMELVASSKMKKTQDAIKKASPILKKLLSLSIIWQEPVQNTNTPSLKHLNKKPTFILLWAQTRVCVAV